MSMVLTVHERLAERLRLLAIERGASVDEVAADLMEASPDLPVLRDVPDEDADLLEEFLGCGASGDHQPRTIHELRDELSAAQLARPA
jgi:hypothetical protein